MAIFVLEFGVLLRAQRESSHSNEVQSEARLDHTSK